MVMDMTKDGDNGDHGRCKDSQKTARKETQSADAVTMAAEQYLGHFSMPNAYALMLETADLDYQ